ncbi:MAG: hypothetical protein U9R15_09670 [Chloroflexota bacterium]|nr:hypothetical protein [Chloroflexota bacterium]
MAEALARTRPAAQQIRYVFTFHIEQDPDTGETVFVFRNIGTHEIYRNP